MIVDRLARSIDPETWQPAEVVEGAEVADDLIALLQVFAAVAPSVHSALASQMLALALPRIAALLRHPCAAVRHVAARSLAVAARVDAAAAMERVAMSVLPLLEAGAADAARRGAVEAVACVVEALQLDVVPYVVVLVVPLLGRMSDRDEPVRLAATHSFAQLVRLMPLDGGAPDPPGLRADGPLAGRRDRERAFLRQLLDPRAIPDHEVGVRVEARLRTYQRAGVNWLAFLKRYRLHGILCDDMGLGKTLQTICVLAGEHVAAAASASASSCKTPPSIVVCPPTLTGHWAYEVDKFVPGAMRTLQYAGAPAEREKLRARFVDHQLVIASYDIVRKDIAQLRAAHFHYCVLDEGHVIKNGKTRTSQAVKQLHAEHRLVLSGTPIQNNVLELWSLFDFLMPGFLGSERQFGARFARPILASREARASPRDQEAGALAMEALHRQVLPFVLRRTKQDVLDDLPPKITQDYYCDLSPLQRQLYEDFARSRACRSLEQHAPTDGPAHHVFQALRYLQNVCNHPKLVLTAAHPQQAAIARRLADSAQRLDDIEHAAKLPALRQLLLDCGIGRSGPAEADADAETAGQPPSAVNQHRALIFCQLRAMLDIVERDLLRRHMPSVAYLRLDGGVPPQQRHATVARFNADPSIDVLLLTTAVGGLGLNLTGADTVIFVEHDWNPMKDAQAMDRAHRIGQRRVVNVYRLVTRDTLEQKIMGLQKFKLRTANTVIAGDNARLDTMRTDRLLDLFASPSPSQSQSQSDATTTTARSLIDSLPDLWDDKQYDDEYDLSGFMHKLRD